MKLKKGTILLDLKLSEAQLFSAFHKRIRKAIKKAEKEGFNLTASEEYDSAYEIYAKSCKFLHLKPKNKEQLFNGLQLFAAKKNDKIVSMYSVEFIDKTAKEIFTGTDPLYRNTQVSSLLKWYIICYSKEKKYEYYNMGGFDPFNKDPKIDNINKYKLQWGGKHKLYYIHVGFFEYLYYYLRHFKSIRFFKKFYDVIFK